MKNYLLLLLYSASVTVLLGQDSGQTSSLRLLSGTVAGQSVSSSNPAIIVAPGAALSGSFTVQINSTWGSTVMAMGATPTWGSHAASYEDLGGFSTPTTGLSRSVPVNWTAPATPGTYYIVAAFRAESDAAHLMSCTIWSYGAPVWNDGNDVADWSAATIETAIANGTVLVNYLTSSGMTQYYVPSTAIRVVVGSQDPGQTSSLRLVSGTVAGQSVSSSNPGITVAPGASVSGSFTVQVNSTWGSTVMALGATPTWGSHAVSYEDLGGFSTPVTGLSRSVPVNWTAPTTPGTYYIVAAFRAESDAAHLMSCTIWSYGAPVWNDGNDVADWSAATIEAAIANGTVLVNYLTSTGMTQYYVPSTAIRVVVQQPTPTDPGQTSSLRLVSGTVAGQSVSSSNPAITVSPGAALSGSFTVQINSTWGSTVMALGATPTWGSHSASYEDLGGFSTPVTGLSRSVPVNWTAPSTPGTYYIVAAFRAESDAAHLMSCTIWSYGAPVWNDGNDVADWSAATIEAAIASGTVLVNYLTSGGMTQYYVPSTAIRVVVQQPTPTDPGQTSSLRLVSGTVAGQSVSSSNPGITVAPGASVSGSFTVQVNSTWGSTVMAMGATPTWGSHAASYEDLGGFSTPVTGLSRSVPVNWTVPSTPGTYYIVAAFRAESDAAHLMSCTIWSYGAPVWNDGNDVADWSAATIEAAIANGTVLVNYLTSTGMTQYYVPSTAIRVVVQQPTPTDPGQTSSLRLVSGTVAGQSVSPSNPAITVAPGAALSGSFTVQINSSWPSTVMAMGATPTWGSHAASYEDLGGFSTPVTGLSRNVPVNWTAPTAPGTYYVVAAFRAESDAAYLMSCTIWSYGVPVWNDGNDVADWPAATIEAAIANGTVLVNYLTSTGMTQYYVPSTAIRVVVQQPAPVPSFYNGADFQPGSISPCSIATIVGPGLAPGIQGVVTPGSLFGPLPYLLASDAVTFNGWQAPILNVSNVNGQQQITVQVPCEVTAASSVPVTVTVGSGLATANVPVLAASPGLSQTQMADGVLRAVIVRPDGSFVSLANPVRRGEIVRAYATGLGVTSPSVGTNATAVPGNDAIVQGTVIVGVTNNAGQGEGVSVISARVAPDLIGMYEISFQMPSDAATGNNVSFSMALIPVGSSTPIYSGTVKIPIQ